MVNHHQHLEHWDTMVECMLDLGRRMDRLQELEPVLSYSSSLAETLILLFIFVHSSPCHILPNTFVSLPDRSTFCHFPDVIS